MTSIEKVQAEYETFTAEFESAILATLGADGRPHASYAPFVMDEAKNIYIYVSGLAAHANNLLTNPRVSVFFAEDEAKTQQIFARRRLNYECVATLIDRGTPLWEAILDRFQNRFGQTVELLRDLTDFRLFRLTPTEGRFVIGFGSAYRLEGDNLERLIPVGGKSGSENTEEG
ncbi:MAG: pyridoxamine 5'-phosphate oxidase family protein [Cyanobacteriota bacterium]|nr:pyridoxamine 5'-phosphate oxidase family protein [Cyanobacteriota bacterium]